MKTVFNIGSVRGITISIHWTFLFLPLWIAAINLLSGSQGEEIIWSIIFFFAILISILIHEAGHALVAKYFGIQASGIILLPIGGVASIPNLPKKPRQEILILLAGPGVNLIIAAVLSIFIHPYSAYWFDAENIGAANAGNFIFQLQIINLSLGIFNLIPAFPMDGGRILRTFLSLNMNILKATRIAGIIGQIFAYTLIALGIIIINIPILLISLFILFASRAEEYYLQLRAIAHGLKLKDVLMRDYDSLDANASVMEVSQMFMNNHNKYYIVMENAKPVGTVQRMQLMKSIAEMKYYVKIKELMKMNLEYLNANAEVEKFIEKLASKDERLYPVLDHNHFEGVISFQHIFEYLLIHSS